MLCTLQILAACIFERLPPYAVKSWLKTKTSLPKILPLPVTTPSPVIFKEINSKELI